jgi:hypothetical protein
MGSLGIETLSGNQMTPKYQTDIQTMFQRSKIFLEMNGCPITGPPGQLILET